MEHARNHRRRNCVEVPLFLGLKVPALPLHQTSASLLKVSAVKSKSATSAVATAVSSTAADNTPVETDGLDTLGNRAGSLIAGNTGGNTGATEFPGTAELAVAATLADTETLAATDFFAFFAIVSGGT